MILVQWFLSQRGSGRLLAPCPQFEKLLNEKRHGLPRPLGGWGLAWEPLQQGGEHRGGGGHSGLVSLAALLQGLGRPQQQTPPQVLPWGASGLGGPGLEGPAALHQVHCRHRLAPSASRAGFPGTQPAQQGSGGVPAPRKTAKGTSASLGKGGGMGRPSWGATAGAGAAEFPQRHLGLFLGCFMLHAAAPWDGREKGRGRVRKW